MPLARPLALVLAFALASVAQAAFAQSPPADVGASAGPCSSIVAAPAAIPAAVTALSLNIASLQLNSGMCGRFSVAGGLGPYVATATVGNVTIAPQPGGAFLVRGARDGYDTITVKDSIGASVALPVLIAADAGVVPGTLTLQFAGRAPLQPAFIAGYLDTQLLRESHLRAGARIASTDPAVIPALATGSTTITLPIVIDGQGRWRDAHGSVAVQLQFIDMPPLNPQLLYFSDDPENIAANQRGVLFRETLPPNAPVRVFSYAQLATSGQRMYIIMQSKGTSRVQVLGDVAGPGFYDDAGHKATLRYLLARRAQRSTIVPLTLNDPVVLPIGSQTVEANRVVTAIYDLLLVDGDSVDVAIVACSGTDDPLAFAALVPDVTFEDTHFRSGVFPLDSQPPIMLSASLGMQFSTPPGTTVQVGSWAIPPVVGKRYLIGDYGVVRPFRLTVTNPNAQPGTLYFYEAPSQAGVTTNVFFDGEPSPVEMKCLQAPAGAAAPHYLIRKVDVPPGRIPIVLTGEFMTDGGSAYPVELGLSAVAPLDPPKNGNCKVTGSQ